MTPDSARNGPVLTGTARTDTALRRLAPAKVNLGLSVLGVRPDGYHDLHSVMAPLSVGDTLDFVPAPDLSLNVVGADLPTDARNLVFRAAQAYLEAAGAPGGVHITLYKHLPLASGLGGGSSDAATTLLALADLYPADVNLPGLALSLGADVPFFLSGGPAVAEGVGERLTPLTLPDTPLVLVNPGLLVSARDAYRWLDEERAFTPPLELEAVRAALTGGTEVPYLNALQAPVVARYPVLEETLSALRAAGLHSPLMSGSGSTCFALARSGAQAQAAARVLRARVPGAWVVAAQVQGAGAPVRP